MDNTMIPMSSIIKSLIIEIKQLNRRVNILEKALNVQNSTVDEQSTKQATDEQVTGQVVDHYSDFVDKFIEKIDDDEHVLDFSTVFDEFKEYCIIWGKSKNFIKKSQLQKAFEKRFGKGKKTKNKITWNGLLLIKLPDDRKVAFDPNITYNHYTNLQTDHITWKETADTLIRNDFHLQNTVMEIGILIQKIPENQCMVLPEGRESTDCIVKVGEIEMRFPIPIIYPKFIAATALKMYNDLKTSEAEGYIDDNRLQEAFILLEILISSDVN